jgi:D-sedoheptulose 7-phosphate isomerase
MTRQSLSPEELSGFRAQCRAAGKRIVSTSGCFDLLHTGHVCMLERAKALGDVLVVGLNSDASVRRLKGEGRPLIPQQQRARLLTALRPVDYVTIFDDLLPAGYLARLQPDVYCKAADYATEALPEREVVLAQGGEVRILPLEPGLSTSAVIGRIAASASAACEPDRRTEAQTSAAGRHVLEQLLEGANVIRQSAYQLAITIEEVGCQIAAALLTHKVLLCGNGGSAADAQHVAAELVGRFRNDRNPLPAIALTTDTSVLTAVSNDFGYEQVFARQVAALGLAGDILIAISTSGKSANVVLAAREARKKGLTVIALTGAERSPLSEHAHLCLRVPAHDTALIQQAHISILHAICDQVDRILPHIADAN